MTQMSRKLYARSTQHLAGAKHGPVLALLRCTRTYLENKPKFPTQQTKTTSNSELSAHTQGSTLDLLPPTDQRKTSHGLPQMGQQGTTEVEKPLPMGF